MKKLVPAVVLAAALPFSALAQAEGQAASPVDGFMNQFDLNKDSKVSADEFKKVQTEALDHQVEMARRQIDQQFQHMDKDKSGAVDKGEVEAFAKEFQQHMEQMQQMHGGSSGKAQ